MKKEQLLFIERCFNNIKLEKDVDKNIKLIENAIKREYDIKIKISIIENKNNTFFGMTVYPHMSEIEFITKMMLENGTVKEIEKAHREFMSTTEKVVEIDSLLLYDQNLNTTSGEITAILLHEIGHVIASDTMVHRFKRAKEYMLAKFDSRVRKIMTSNPIATKIMVLPMTQIYSNQFNVQLLNEQKADNFAVREGYGEELYSVLGKLVIDGKSSIIKKSEREVDKDIEVTIDWVVVNVKELGYRKDKLKKSLKIIKLTTPSKHIGNIIDTMTSRIFKQDVPKAILLNEAFIISNIKGKYDKAPSGAMEHGKVKKLNTRDLDIYRAELDRVNTVDDKIFLLERLYDLLDQAEYAMYMINNDPKRVTQSENTINLYLDNLNDIIKTVNNKKISQTKFGLYIKYPEGYEG